MYTKRISELQGKLVELESLLGELSDDVDSEIDNERDIDLTIDQTLLESLSSMIDDALNSVETAAYTLTEAEDKSIEIEKGSAE